MKQFILALILILSCTLAFTQNTYGLRSGLSLANIYGDYTGNTKAKVGGTFGCFGYYPISNLIIQPEVNYIQKGYKIYAATWESYYTVTASYNYIEVPILLKLNLKATDFNLQPYFGPSISLLVNATERIEIDNGSGSNEDQSTNVQGNMNALELNLDVGFDLLIKKRFLLGIRYSPGLTNANKYTGVYHIDIKNSVFTFNLGVM